MTLPSVVNYILVCINTDTIDSKKILSSLLELAFLFLDLDSDIMNMSMDLDSKLTFGTLILVLETLLYLIPLETADN